MSSLMTVRMTRPNSGVVWGFRLYGGAEYGIPIVIPKIMTRSVAERAGLRVNDRIVAINHCNAEKMTHEQAKMEIIRTGNDLTFVIMRPDGDQPFEPLPPREIPNYPCNYVNPNPPAQYPANIVSQKVQMVSVPQEPARISPPQAPVQDPSPPPPVQQEEPSPPAKQPLKVDVDKAQEAALDDLPDVLSPRDILASPAFQEPPQQKAKKFSPKVSGKKAAVPNVVHAQYNSPMGLYSAENIAAQYATQTAGIQKEMESVDIGKKPVGTTMSGTYQVLDSK